MTSQVMDPLMSLLAQNSKAQQAYETLKQEKPHWIEPHAIAVRFGLSKEDSRLFLWMPGYRLKYKIYHCCCETVVGVSDMARLPEEIGWICPYCEEVAWEEDVSFEEVGVLESDRDATA